MKITAKTGDRLLEVTVERQDGTYIVEVEGTRHEVDAHKLEGDFYSILIGGKSYDVSVEVARDSYRVRHGAAERVVTLSDPGRQAREAAGGPAGPQPITTAMPGKDVRVLVNGGDEVEQPTREGFYA